MIISNSWYLARKGNLKLQKMAESKKLIKPVHCHKVLIKKQLQI